VDDQQTWRRAKEAVEAICDRLSPVARGRLDQLLERIMALKQELFELSATAGSARICRECGGRCCLNGKYHVSVLDLVAYRCAGVAPVVPDFGKAPLCPYGGSKGCLMPPRFRSVTCLIFNCDLVEDRMEAANRKRFSVCERELRDAVAMADELLAYRAGRALLLSFDEQPEEV
jgi:hypothetical protein